MVQRPCPDLRGGCVAIRIPTATEGRGSVTTPPTRPRPVFVRSSGDAVGQRRFRVLPDHARPCTVLRSAPSPGNRTKTAATANSGESWNRGYMSRPGLS